MVDISLLARLAVVEADITSLDVDVVVNAANESLMGGGGVDGAIHRAAGPELRMACQALGGCPTGQARLTPGFGLKAAHVIHAVGPVWRGGGTGEAALLASAYRSSLDIARQIKARSIAFPAVSTGVFGYPWKSATRIALDAVLGALGEAPLPEQVIFCCFYSDMAELYRSMLGERGAALI